MTAPIKPTLAQRWVAFVFKRGNKSYENAVKQRKRALMSQLGGTIVEIGPGAGANLQYLPPGVRWFGVEPNPAMIENLKRTADAAGLKINIIESRAEKIDLPDAFADHVICTLVLCSPPDPGLILKEAARILKPGGTFVFIEHVAAPRGSFYRYIQQFARPLWRRINDGCCPDRDTGALIERAGFKRVQIENFRTGFPIVSPHIAGVVVK
ncbi:MAG: class I SAM-dependent methyltransferase [Planctomycetes bacterium]|nr:class I SAM-dependent methyltransferase [Planctomycetota bacterium]